MTLAINYDLLITALEKFLEADQADRRDRNLRPLTRQLTEDIAAYFEAVLNDFLGGMESFRTDFDRNAVEEAINYAEWVDKLTAAERKHIEKIVGPLEEAVMDAMIMGNEDLYGLIKDDDPDDIIKTAFNVVNAEAGPYAETYAAARVTQINTTTRNQLNTLISQGIDSGWSYDRLAEKIVDMGGFSEERARRIAVYELRDAYEGGQFKMISRMNLTGLPMETAWLTAGDDRVRDSHRASQAEGWQDVGYVFASGAERPPVDPGCRCTSLYRRKK
jgi:uncharacterized protein with gpF-like domain